MKSDPLNRPITVNLSARQHEAVEEYARHRGITKGKLARTLVTTGIPPRFWRPTAPPPGQLRLGEDVE